MWHKVHLTVVAQFKVSSNRSSYTHTRLLPSHEEGKFSSENARLQMTYKVLKKWKICIASSHETAIRLEININISLSIFCLQFLLNSFSMTLILIMNMIIIIITVCSEFLGRKRSTVWRSTEWNTHIKNEKESHWTLDEEKRKSKQPLLDRWRWIK